MLALVHLHFTTVALWWQHTGTGEQPKPYLQTIQLLVVCMSERAMSALTPSESAAYHQDRPQEAPSPASDKSMRPITFKEVQLWLQWNLKCPEIIDCATKSLMEKAEALTKGLQTVRDRGGKICQGEQRRVNQE